MGTLDGRVALVTGAGRGIGRAIALKLAAEGASMVVNDLNDEPADEVVSLIRASGGKAVACVGSVVEVSFGDRFVAAAVETFGDVDIVVNNAGYAIYGASEHLGDDDWHAVLGVLLTAPFRILAAAARHARDHGVEPARVRKFINVSSIGARTGAPRQGAYGPAKAGLDGLTVTLAKEWGPLGITVNGVAPGIIRTRLTEGPATGHGSIVADGREIELTGVPLDDLTARVPVGRLGTPADIAGAVYLLCLPEADYVTGQVLAVDGGFS